MIKTMVKDQYANYVIQRIIQTCSGDQREMLLGRIRTHLNSLKKYTYGKHIVARFEQLYGEGQYSFSLAVMFPLFNVILLSSLHLKLYPSEIMFEFVNWLIER